MTNNSYARFGKRLFDAVLSSIGVTLLSPLLLVVAISVRLSSPGPALFSQIRTGRLGKPFRIFKFRTMIAALPSSGSLLTASGDPRVTPLGRWLRKTKIDELPQLFNVLMGQMSFVGPRPEVPIFTARYDRRQRAVLLVRPGITCPGIDFDEEELLANAEDKEDFYVNKILPAKLEADLAYCRSIRFWTDQKIILQTVAGVLVRFGGGADGIRPAIASTGAPSRGPSADSVTVQAGSNSPARSADPSM